MNFSVTVVVRNKKMKRATFAAMICSLLCMTAAGLTGCSETVCMHTGGHATCIEQAICENCGERYGELGAHSFDKYVCIYCGTKTECSLEIIGTDYETAMLKQAKQNAGALTGKFSLAILDKNETLPLLANYDFSDNFDKSSIVRGLFVKFECTELDSVLYYNFGLECSEAQTNNVAVSTGTPQDPWYDTWTLEVVPGNEKLLFQFSVAQ